MKPLWVSRSPGRFYDDRGAYHWAGVYVGEEPVCLLGVRIDQYGDGTALAFVSVSGYVGEGYVSPEPRGRRTPEDWQVYGDGACLVRAVVSGEPPEGLVDWVIDNAPFGATVADRLTRRTDYADGNH
jgi:hypothetical protein